MPPCALADRGYELLVYLGRTDDALAARLAWPATARPVTGENVVLTEKLALKQVLALAAETGVMSGEDGQAHGVPRNGWDYTPPVDAARSYCNVCRRPLNGRGHPR